MVATAQSFDPVERRKYIGCSELGAVLGVDQYKTPLDIYNLKCGLVEPFEGNRHTLRGNRLEAIAAQLFTEITGRKLRRNSETFTHPDHPFISGHIDRTVVGERRIAEIKAPSVAAFRKFQREGLPDSMIVQMNGYLGLTNYNDGTFIIFCADQMDVLSFDVTFDETIYNAAIEAAVKLWSESILLGIPPAPLDLDKPKLEFERIAGDVVRRDDENWAEAAQLLREADQLKKDGEELFELAKKKVIDAVEDVEGCYEGAGLRLHYKSQAGRKSLDKKALAAAHPEISLERFEKQGSPFKTFRPFFINE